VDKLWLATSGDIYLIRKISERSLEMVRSRTSDRLRSKDVNIVINRFCGRSFPLRSFVGAIRLIEDPDLLKCVLLLLEQENIPRSAYIFHCLRSRSALSDRRGQRVPGRSVSTAKFDLPPISGSTFHTMAGGQCAGNGSRWDSAIDYLEAGIQQGSCNQI
jgi:hypothetical protein